jgi:hypothetical protein
VELFLALHMVLDTPKEGGPGTRVASYYAWVAQQDLVAADTRRGVWERCRRDLNVRPHTAIKKWRIVRLGFGTW